MIFVFPTLIAMLIANANGLIIPTPCWWIFGIYAALELFFGFFGEER